MLKIGHALAMFPKSSIIKIIKKSHKVRIEIKNHIIKLRKNRVKTRRVNKYKNLVLPKKSHNKYRSNQSRSNSLRRRPLQLIFPKKNIINPKINKVAKKIKNKKSLKNNSLQSPNNKMIPSNKKIIRMMAGLKFLRNPKKNDDHNLNVFNSFIKYICFIKHLFAFYIGNKLYF